MARRKKPSGGSNVSRKRQLAREKRLSKKLGYSVTANRRKQARAKSKAYVKQAKDLSKFVPSLKSLSRKKVLTKGEIQRVKNQAKKLAHVPGLVAVPKKWAKKHKKLLYRKGVEGIQFSNISSNAKIDFEGDDIVVTSNGEHWIYWQLDRDVVKSKKKFAEKAREAFEQRYPIEKALGLAHTAFKKLQVKQIHLWGPTGRVGRGFPTIAGFEQWLSDKFQAGRYVSTDPTVHTSDPAAWINGIAIMVTEKPVVKRKRKTAK